MAEWDNSGANTSGQVGSETVSDNNRIQMRWLLRRDMDKALIIENASFEYPWTDEDFLRCLRQKNCIGMAAEVDDELVGYVVYELNSKHIRILNLAVSPDARRKGVGTAIASCLLKKTSSQRRNAILADVRESNLGAQLYFRSCGFQAYGVDRGCYYDSTDESAYLLKFTVTPDKDELNKWHPKNRVASYLSEPSA